MLWWTLIITDGDKMDTKKRLLIIALIVSVIFVGIGLVLLNKKNIHSKEGTTSHFLYQVSSGPDWGSLVFPQQVLPYKGKLYIADPSNSRIIVFDRGGKYLFQFEKVPLQGKHPAPYPYGLSADDKGNIYVTDSESGKVLIYNEQGRFLSYFAADAHYTPKPAGIFIRNGRVFIADLKLHQVHIFDFQGNLLSTIGSGKPGTANTDLNFPNSVVVDKEGRIYVTDNKNNRIQVFDRNGKYHATLGVGQGLKLINPRGIALDPAGNIYIANTLNKSFKVLDKNQKFLYDVTDGNNYAFNVVAGIAVDRDNIYVADRTLLVLKK